MFPFDNAQRASCWPAFSIPAGRPRVSPEDDVLAHLRLAGWLSRQSALTCYLRHGHLNRDLGGICQDCRGAAMTQEVTEAEEADDFSLSPTRP